MNIKKFDSINVVPFIDIMLVLLVIVLTTATFVAKGIIPVDLPQSSSSIEQKDKEILTITIKNDGEMFFNDKNIDIDDIDYELSSYEKTTSVQINCDKDAKFDIFVKVLDQLKNQEFENLGIITKNE